MSCLLGIQPTRCTAERLHSKGSSKRFRNQMRLYRLLIGDPRFRGGYGDTWPSPPLKVVEAISQDRRLTYFFKNLFIMK